VRPSLHEDMFRFALFRHARLLIPLEFLLRISHWFHGDTQPIHPLRRIDWKTRRAGETSSGERALLSVKQCAHGPQPIAGRHGTYRDLLAAGERGVVDYGGCERAEEQLGDLVF